MDGNARQKMMQASVAARRERYEVDYEGKREENPWSGFWWGMRGTNPVESELRTD